MRVVAYTRVSTQFQAEAGVSLEAQRSRLQAYADLYDLEVVSFIEDAGLSAKTLDRPGLQAALNLLASGDAEGILVAKLDRLTRSVRDLGSLLDLGFRDRFALLSVSEQINTKTAAGRLLLNLLATISQWERETTAERTSAALQHLRSEGVRLGGEALGWHRLTDRDSDGRQLVRDVQEEVATIQRIEALRAEGLSLRGIASTLRSEGRKTKKGGSWHPETVRRILARVA